MKSFQLSGLLLLALALLLGLYAGGYYLCVDDWDMSIPPTHDTDNDVWYAPKYRVGGGFSHFVFAPAHFVDQMVRPDKWRRHAPPPLITPPYPREDLPMETDHES